ncbi:MAG: isochorismatase [Epulopiscium sp. Nuni2H_MBin003]|nr:MAG: isochorismatase [Epulopiscium sp. Nuni2H_MBin003]
MKKALIIIDYVYDFVADDGKLTCGKCAQSIDEFISTKVKDFSLAGDFVVTAIDLHDAQDLFNKEREMFPAHCYDQKGQALYGKTRQAVADTPPSQYIAVNKNRYSAFFGTNLDLKLKERNVHEIHLTGVCTDICILHTAIDAYNLGYDITIYKDGVASFNTLGHEYALEHFKNILGATVI